MSIQTHLIQLIRFSQQIARTKIEPRLKGNYDPTRHPVRFASTAIHDPPMLVVGRLTHLNSKSLRLRMYVISRRDISSDQLRVIGARIHDSHIASVLIILLCVRILRPNPGYIGHGLGTRRDRNSTARKCIDSTSRASEKPIPSGISCAETVTE